MRLSFLTNCFSAILFLTIVAEKAIAQPAQSVYYEANMQAYNGNISAAFAILSTDAKKGNCMALGYYWQWSLDLAFTKDFAYNNFIFSSALPFGKQAKLGTTFNHQFSEKEHIIDLAKRCTQTGIVNKAAGTYYIELEKTNSHLDYTDSILYYLGIALKTGAYDTFTLYHYALALQEKGKFQEGIYYYKKSFDIDDGQLNSLLGTAACFSQIYKYDSAIYYAQEVVDRSIFSSASPEQVAAAYRIIANAHFEKGNNKVAKSYYKRAFAVDKDNYATHLSYFKFLAQTKPRKGCKHGKEIYKRFPGEETKRLIYKYLAKKKADKIVGK